jgi:hypothetical protein
MLNLNLNQNKLHFQSIHAVFSKCTNLFCYSYKLRNYNHYEIGTWGQCFKTFYSRKFFNFRYRLEYQSLQASLV